MENTIGTFLPIDKLQEQYRMYQDSKEAERYLARQCRDYENGDQWTVEEKQALQERGQAPSVYNYVRRKMNALVGIEEQTRRDPRAYARNDGVDEKSAKVATATIRFVNEKNRFEFIGMRALHHGAVSGIGGERFGLALKGNEISIEQEEVDPKNFFYDPRSEKHDFADAGFMGLAKYTTKESLKSLFPDQSDLIDSILDQDGTEYEPYDRNSDTDYGVGSDLSDWAVNPWDYCTEDKFFIVEHHYLHKGRWCIAYWVGDTIIWQNESPFIDEDGISGHMFNMWSAYISDDLVRYGEVKDMLSPQDGINKRTSKLLYMLSVRQTRGEKGAVDDVNLMKDELATPDGHVTVNTGRNFEILSQSDQIDGQAQLLQNDKVEMEQTGVNEALVGEGGGANESGVAIREKKAAGMAKISPSMQEFRRWKLNSYRKTWNLVKRYWTSSRLIRVTEEEKAPEFIGLNQVEVIKGEDGQSELKFSNVIAKLDVDIILDEGADTVTLQDQDFQELTQLASNGIPIPPEIILKASRLRNKDELIEALEKEKESAQPSPEALEQQQELEQRRMEQDLEEQAARTAKIQSEVELNKVRADMQRLEMEQTARHSEMLVNAPVPETLQ